MLYSRLGNLDIIVIAFGRYYRGYFGEALHWTVGCSTQDRSFNIRTYYHCSTKITAVSLAGLRTVSLVQYSGRVIQDKDIVVIAYGRDLLGFFGETSLDR